ncbi:MAG TPA: hypothetical protein VGG39_03115 [Polyangiaceae bacterium]|jgi:hypothetical protein
MVPFVHPRNLAQMLGADARRRGKRSERHVLQALSLPSRPEWMRSVRPATKEEDRAGIDVVVESDVGKLFVQVKSSQGGKARFEAKRRSARIAVVVAKVTDTPEGLLRKVVGELSTIRAEYVTERAGG